MPGAVAETVRVQGLRELQAAFRAADKRLLKELRESLSTVAEPVRADAERLATQEITRIGIPWSQMRTGFTTVSVYVAPVARGRLSRRNPQRYARPNLAGLLFKKALEPALERNVNVVTNRLERVLDDVGRTWEQAA